MKDISVSPAAETWKALEHDAGVLCALSRACSVFREKYA